MPREAVAAPPLEMSQDGAWSQLKGEISKISSARTSLAQEMPQATSVGEQNCPPVPPCVTEDVGTLRHPMGLH